MSNSNLRWEFYQDNAGKWRWRAVSIANGKIVGASSEGFESKQGAINNAKLMGYS
jgi:uncharacterized protein YegP (UPF0339 family)